MIQRPIYILVLLLQANFSFSQVDARMYKGGSYANFGQPSIEDNSMFVEEAFNQPKGIVQHRSTVAFREQQTDVNYTVDIPLSGERHQLSLGVEYVATGNGNYVGECVVSYRPSLMGKSDWMLVTPRFSVIVPMQKNGSGWGGQFNLAVTKRISRKIVSHFNSGFTSMHPSGSFRNENVNDTEEQYSHHTISGNLGGSMIWLFSNRLNFMLEYAQSFGDQVQEGGSVKQSNELILNPGVRTAFDMEEAQLVLGMGIPLYHQQWNFTSPGLCVYLSFEY
jgi:hypothetical protein